MRRKANLRLATLVEPAIATLAGIMVSPTARDSDRLRAAENVLDRAGFPRRLETGDQESAREILVARLLAIREQREREASPQPGVALIEPPTEESRDEG